MTTIAKVHRVGKKLFAYQGEFAGESEALIDFKEDLKEPDAKKILKRSQSTVYNKLVYNDGDLKQPQNFKTRDT